MAFPSRDLGPNHHACPLLATAVSHKEHLSLMHVLLCYSSHLYEAKEKDFR